jgi:hypothetical protein
MSNQWFRLYSEILNDPKVQNLSPELFRDWINILCIASKNNGTLPETFQEVAFSLRIDEIAAISVVNRLVIAGLLDKVKGGTNGYRIAPHGWEKRQYKSDSSTERVKRFRGVTRNVSETPPEQNRTEQITNTKVLDAKAAFWNCCREYLGKPKMALVGKWVKDYGEEKVFAAVLQAQKNNPAEPITYIIGILKPTVKTEEQKMTEWRERNRMTNPAGG